VGTTLAWLASRKWSRDMVGEDEPGRFASGAWSGLRRRSDLLLRHLLITPLCKISDALPNGQAKFARDAGMASTSSTAAAT